MSSPVLHLQYMLGLTGCVLLGVEQDVVRIPELIHPKLPPMLRVNPRSGEYEGPCPFCGGGTNRFHVWTKEQGKRPAWRYWCRSCGVTGRVDDEDNRAFQGAVPPRKHVHDDDAAVAPNPKHIPEYRAIYMVAALWAHTWLLDAVNPDPLRELAQRGVTRACAESMCLGYGLRDNTALATHLKQSYPDLYPYAEAAGVLWRDRMGNLVTHPNLCGALIFPYIADGEFVDLRARKLGTGHNTRSLPGAQEDRGAIFPQGWDEIDGNETILLTESGEYKALVALNAYSTNKISIPTLGQPGLSNVRQDWIEQLPAKGVKTVIIVYDTQPRKPNKKGVLQLAPEEQWIVRVGTMIEAAGMQARVIRLPLQKGLDKEDLDHFILHQGTRRLQAFIDEAPLFYEYQMSLPADLRKAAHLPEPLTYPLRRPRPQRSAATRVLPCSPAIPVKQVRHEIYAKTYAHAMAGGGNGMLLLAHPPGAGKGHNTTRAIRDYVRDYVPVDGKTHFVVWSALRKNQIDDQKDLKLIPLHGRNPGNCQNFAAAAELSKKGYSVREALCVRRCPFANRCVYLNQFGQEGDFFAPIPLLQATGWWRDSNVLIIDEDITQSFTRIVILTSADIAAIATTAPDFAKAVLRWLAQLQGHTLDRMLTGTLLYQELEAEAANDGLDFATTIRKACDALPDPKLLAGIPDLKHTAGLLDFQSLPPNYLYQIISILSREQNKRLGGTRFTSRLQMANGRLVLLLRQEHLIEQLANPDQSKILLDATPNIPLLKFIFPDMPMTIERPRIDVPLTVRQIIGQDWAKSTLGYAGRRERWIAEVSKQIRPDRPTLVVCSLECENELRHALHARGYSNVTVAHYGGLRGTNAYKGCDVILAQIYNPNPEAIVREARALFADDTTPLDERMLTAERTLSDTAGTSWTVHVTTFADARIAALLEARREAEMFQVAMRGRPIDNPHTQITLLTSLPIPGLDPTSIEEADASEESNTGRMQRTLDRLVTATRRLISTGKRVFDVETVASAADTSVTTVRKHWQALAEQLGLTEQGTKQHGHMHHGGVRSYTRRVLIVPRTRGRAVPEHASEPAADAAMMDHACNMDLTTRVIHHKTAYFSRAARPPAIRSTSIQRQQARRQKQVRQQHRQNEPFEPDG